MCVFQGAPGVAVRALAGSLDGSLLLAGGSDGVLRVWDLKQCLADAQRIAAAAARGAA